ncbi:hypothetical protein pb186bvf_015362 [Paramecium bursaria]
MNLMDILKKLDQFGVMFTLPIKYKDMKYKSALGGLATIILYSCNLAYFIYKIYLWQTRQILPTITSQTNSINYFEKNFTNQNPLAINFFYEGDDPFSYQKNYITCFYIDILTSQATSIKLLPPMPSKIEGQSSLIIPENLQLVLNVNKQQLPKPNQQGFLLFGICNKTTAFLYNITCASDIELSQFLSKTHGFNFWITYQMFNAQSQTLEKIEQLQYLNLDFYAPFFAQLSFQISEQYVDDNLFYTSSSHDSYVSNYKLITQPLSKQLSLLTYGIEAVAGILIGISPNSVRENISYPKLGSILADVGSIMSALLTLSILFQIINGHQLEDRLIFEVLTYYFPEYKNLSIKRNMFGKIKNIRLNNQEIDKDEFLIQYEQLKEQARNKLTVVNQIYELSRIQFILLKHFKRDQIIESHNMGIQLKLNCYQDQELTQLDKRLQKQDLNADDFTIFTLKKIETQLMIEDVDSRRRLSEEQP